MMDRVNFLRKFINSPATIGSIAPSSPVLVTTMMAEIDWQHMGVIAELGAGTGVVTRAINERRHRESVFFSFEKDEQMNIALKHHFPGVMVGDDAFKLSEIMALHGYHQLDCVISCLPFANFRRQQQTELLECIHTLLAPGGLFIAFQYSLQLQSCLKAVYEKVECRFVMKNLPPAIIYVCRKQPCELVSQL